MTIGGIASATLAESDSAYRKLERIQAGRLAPGTRIQFSPAELNAWLNREAKQRAPQGVRNLRFVLANGSATGYADIDFLKLHQAATGELPGWLAKNLFGGSRPVSVTARFQSRAGQARVDVERVEISGVAIEGRMLDFLVADFLRPEFPDAQVSQWFRLRYGVDHFTVGPRGVIVAVTRPGS